VAELASRAAPVPHLAVEHDATADAGAPPDADEVLELAACAELELAEHCHADVVAELDLRATGLADGVGQGICVGNSGQVRRVREQATVGVDRTGRPDANALEGLRRAASVLTGRLNRSDDRIDDALRPTVLRRGHTTLAAQLPLGVDDDDLDLGPTEVYSTHALTHGRRAYHVAKWRRIHAAAGV